MNRKSYIVNSLLFLIFVISGVALLYLERGYAIEPSSEAPSWTSTENFMPPAGYKRATGHFSGTVSFSNAQMNVDPTPEEVFDSVGGDYTYPWKLWNDWWYPMWKIAEQDPVGAVPLFNLDGTLFPGLEG